MVDLPYVEEETRSSLKAGGPGAEGGGRRRQREDKAKKNDLDVEESGAMEKGAKWSNATEKLKGLAKEERGRLMK